MRLNKLLFLGVLLLSTLAEAQDLRIIVDKKGKVGYADQYGNEVIKCQYESGQPFSDGTAIVSKSGKYGIIGTSGNVLLPLNYTQITLWHGNLYLIKDGKKMGLANRGGSVVLPAEYSHISKPNCYGKALIALGGKATPNDKKTYMANAKYGIINENGTILVNPKYRGLYEFSMDCTEKYPYYEGKRLEYSYHNTSDTLITDCSFLGFNNNGFNIYEAGIMDGNGTELLKMGLYHFVMQPQSSMVRYYEVKKKQTICGYHNLTTGNSFQAAVFDNNISDMNFWSHGDFIGNIAPVNGSSWKFIDTSGHDLRTGYSSLKHSANTGLWAAKNNSKWIVFDDNDNDIAALSGFSEIGFPSEKGDKEVYTVVKDGKYGVVNRSGEEIIPFGKYDTIWVNKYDFICVKKAGKYGAVTPEDRTIIPVEYTDVIFPNERNAKHLWVKKSDSMFYHLNAENKRISSTGYEYVMNFKNGIALVVPKGLKVEDTQVNRAQIFAPNTAKATIDAYDMSQAKGVFGYLIDTNDNVLFDLPVSTSYMDTVVKVFKEKGNRNLSENEKKIIILDVTKENRSYDLNSTLSEDEWNY